MKKSFERAQRRREEGHGYKHDLGQNFLYDDALLEELVQSTGVTKADSVLEIGPGSGMLTKHLCPHAGKVLAVEVDHDIIPFLKVNTAAFSNLEIVEGDIRKQNLRELCAPLGENFLVIANIPYNITTPIFEVLWESGLSIRQISVMIQKEVAQRLCAAPGTGEYGAFSVLVQWYAEPKLLFDVPPHCFVPQPKVTSAVVRMDRRAAPPASVDDEKLFFRTVRAAFAQRRKTLSNALRSAFSELDRAAIESALEETGLPPAVRGETLSIAQFAALSNALLRKFDK